MTDNYATDFYQMLLERPWLGLANEKRLIFRSKNPELFALQMNKLRAEEFSNLPEIPEEDNTDFAFEAYHRELDKLKILVDEIVYELPSITEWWWPHTGTWEEDDRDRRHKKFVKHIKHCMDLKKATY